MDKSIIDEETFLFIYSNICRQYNLPYSENDINDEELDGENYKIVYLISKLVQEIVIKTNRNTFPTDLKYLVIDLAENAYSVVRAETNPETNQNITSMSEAGRSVSFGATDSWKTKYNLLLQQQLITNDNLINKYKLLYKVGCPYAKN